MDRQDLKAQLTKTQELLSIAIKEKDTADMILDLGGFLFCFFFGRKGLRSKNVAGGDPVSKNQVVWPKIGMLLGVVRFFVTP